MLEVKNISATYGNFALQNISFHLESGKHLAIVGPTGAGKTSLMEIIAGVRKHHSGSIVLDGRDITKLPPHRRNIAMLYQQLSLFPHLNVRKNIEYPLRWRREKGLMTTEEIARKLGIEHLLSRKIHMLSGGEKQRVALARALITKPRILMLDEPLSGIDLVTKQQVISTIKEVQNSFGISTIIITHSPEEAYTLADIIAIIKGGRLIHIDRKEIIWNDPKDIWFAHMIGIKNIVPIEKWLGIYPLHINTRDYTHVGIHPSSIYPTKEGRLRGQVVDIIHYPHHTEVIVNISGVNLTWKILPEETLSKGEYVSLDIKPEHIHLLKEG